MAPFSPLPNHQSALINPHQSSRISRPASVVPLDPSYQTDPPLPSRPHCPFPTIYPFPAETPEFVVNRSSKVLLPSQRLGSTVK